MRPLDELLVLKVPEPPAIANGTIGWDGVEKAADIDTTADDGVTLVRVTLHSGAPQGAPTAASGAANGQQILCRITWPLWVIPPKGMQCLVAFPDGLTRTPGAGIIFACTGRGPATELARGVAVLDLPNHDLMIDTRSTTILNEVGDSLSLTDGGFKAMTYNGSLISLKDSEMIAQMYDGNKATKASLSMNEDEVILMNCGANAGCKFVSAGPVFVGGVFQMNYTTSISFGIGASAATKVMVGPTIGTASTGSQTMFGSP